MSAYLQDVREIVDSREHVKFYMFSHSTTPSEAGGTASTEWTGCCLVGAMGAALDGDLPYLDSDETITRARVDSEAGDHVRLLLDILAAARTVRHSNSIGISSFNDDPNTRKEDVLALLDGAIPMALERGLS